MRKNLLPVAQRLNLFARFVNPVFAVATDLRNVSDVIGNNLGDAKSISPFHIVLLQFEDTLEVSFTLSKITFHAREGLNLVPVTTDRERGGGRRGEGRCSSLHRYG